MRFASAVAVSALLSIPASGAVFAHDRVAVVWADADRNVHFAAVPVTTRFVPDGTIVGSGSAPQVCALGDGFLVLWWQSGSLVAVRVTADAAVLDVPFTVATGVYRFAVASSGDEAMVAWCSLSELRTVRITTAGVAIAAPEAAAAFEYGAWVGPIAFDGERYVLSWSRYESSPCTHCIGTLTTPFITFIDRDGRAISTLRPPIDVDALAAGAGVAVGVGGPQSQPQFIRIADERIEGPNLLRNIDSAGRKVAWTGGWFVVTIGMHPVRVTVDGRVFDDPDIAPVGAWIDELLWSGPGVAAVTYDSLTGRPVLTFVVPFPKHRGVWRP